MVVVATRSRDKQHAINFLFTVEIHQRFKDRNRKASISNSLHTSLRATDRDMCPGRRIFLLAVLQLLTRATPTFPQGELVPKRREGSRPVGRLYVFNL